MDVRVPRTIDQFEVDHAWILGKGTYGIVYRGRDTQTDDLVAIKFMTPSTNCRDNFMKSYKRELDALRNIRHPNIVHRIHDKIIGDSVYIILELCAYNLDTFASRNELTQDLKGQFVEEIISAVHYLHQALIIHRDIKPENILVKLEGDLKKIKLTDFGLSKCITGDAATATAGAGTQLWMAPEVFFDEKGKPRYGKSADCFSLGLVFSQLERHTEGSLPPPITGKRHCKSAI